MSKTWKRPGSKSYKVGKTVYREEKAVLGGGNTPVCSRSNRASEKQTVVRDAVGKPESLFISSKVYISKAFPAKHPI